MKRIIILFCILNVLFPCIFINAIPSDIYFDISKGRVQGHRLFTIRGHNEDIGTSFETLWANGTLYPFLTTHTYLNISSSDVNDTLTGSGARTVYVEGLDNNYNQINETLNMNGQTPVSTINQYLRINKMYVVLVGATTLNEGIIYLGTGPITNGKPLNVYYIIDAQYGESQVGVFTVPVNKTVYILNEYISTFASVEKEFELFLRIRCFNQSIRRLDEHHMVRDNTYKAHIAPLVCEGRTDIDLIAKVDVGSGVATFDIDIILVDSDRHIPTPVMDDFTQYKIIIGMIVVSVSIGGLMYLTRRNK